MPISQLPPELKQAVALELMDLMDTAVTSQDGYHLSKRLFRQLVAERFEFQKLRCTICRLWRDREDFCRNGSKARGLDYECRSCRARFSGVRAGKY